jgi:Zn-dependent peptidase ImmA (M78 family)
MSDIREIILGATLEAERLHKELDSAEHLRRSPGSVDVFGAIEHLGLGLLFRPLDGLLGAYVPVENDSGILVTTERPLAIQRFTAAHELGHAYLKHELMLDDDQILKRSPFARPMYDHREIAADTFAAMFLMPDWLINLHAERQGWDWQSLSDPICVYQLALRMGVSYEAICRTLRKYNLLDNRAFASLNAIPPKEIKQKILPENPGKSWHPNVWLLTERDQGSIINGEPSDIFVVRLKEMSGAGYLWNLDQVQTEGFAIVRDERRLSPSDDLIGGAVERVLTVQAEAPRNGVIFAEQARPWEPTNPLATFSFSYDFRGKEHGWARVTREVQLAA